MTRLTLTRFSPIALLALAVLLSTAGCKSNQTAANNGQTATPDSSSDPASANLAPASTTDTQSAATTATPTTQSAAAPAATAASAPAASAPAASESNASVSELPTATEDDTSYGVTPVATAPQAPPPLPEYQQPPAPADGYLWTPGYWAWAPAGYYWVPGVWVQAPYEGALWTPPYWGIYHGHYGFFHGYWGRHIGFYGGVNYGFGYGGVGYQGGYWNGGHFAYNRSVNNVNVNVIHNVYDYRVATNNNVRVSFNGGQGGLQVRARPTELVAAFREPHAAPMRTQVEIEHTASTNRAAFVTANHGRPAAVVIEKPIAADRDVHPVAPLAPRIQAGRPEAHPNAAPAHVNEPARNAERPASHAEAAPHAAPGAHPQANHPQANQPRPQEHAAPHAAPGARPQANQPRAQEHAAPAAHPQANQPRAQEHAAPHAAPAAKPAVREQAKPAPKHEEERPR